MNPASGHAPRPAARPAGRAGLPPPWRQRRWAWPGLLLSLLLHAGLWWEGMRLAGPPALPPERVLTLPLLASPAPARLLLPARHPPVHRRPPRPRPIPPPVVPALAEQALPVPLEPPPPDTTLPLPELPLAGEDLAGAAAPPAGGATGSAAAGAASGASGTSGADLPSALASGGGAAPPGLPDALAGLPRAGEVDYRVTKGSGEWRSGRGTLRWRVEGDHYRLDLDAHAEGLPALFYWSGVHWSSEGRIVAAGLQPERFMKNERDGVRFDWNARTLTFLPSGFVRPLPAGGLDLLSVFFQFALRPPAEDSLDFPVTNGDKIDRYAFELTERTRLKLDLGEVDTVHISRIHKLQDSGFEIWLAQDRNFLPVQMRLYHARLGVLNLYATGIRVDGLHGRLQEP